MRFLMLVPEVHKYPEVDTMGSSKHSLFKLAAKLDCVGQCNKAQPSTLVLTRGTRLVSISFRLPGRTSQTFDSKFAAEGLLGPSPLRKQGK